MPDLNAFLSPTTVAVIGASPDPHILRGRIMNVMMSHEFAGRIVPVSRSHDEIMGLKAYKTVGDIPGAVDFAAIIVPAEFVPGVMEECGRKGVRALQILTSGFAEEVGDSGNDLQRRIQDIAAKYDMAVCGPNSEGFASMAAKLCPTFSPAVEQTDKPLIPEWRDGGRIAAIAQSGGIGFAFYDRGRPKELPFSYVMTTGNEACLTVFDLVEHMIDHTDTEIFTLFLEDIKRPDVFRRVAEKALRANKPIVLVKVGQSAAGERAAASHTAALAGSYGAYRAMFDHYGIIEGGDLEELVDCAAGFSYWRDRLPAGNRVGIVTGSGGAGGWMADACSAAGLEVPELDPKTRAAIDVHLPAYGTSQNPVDGTAGAIRRVGSARLVELVGSSDRIDAVVAITSARSTASIERDFDNLARVARETTKPIAFCSYTMPRPASVELLSRAGLPLFTNFRTCATTIARMANYRAHRERFLRVPEIRTVPASAAKVARDALVKAGGTVCEYEAAAVLAAYGIPTTEGRLAATREEAVAAATALGLPAVLKIQSPDLLHKSDAGGVALGLATADAVGAAFDEVIGNARAHSPKADIRGVLVQRMAPSGVEMVVGVHRDPTFGPMVMVGTGGIFVEVLKDALFAPAPLDAEAARRLIGRLAGAKLLAGVRGRPPADVGALTDVVVRLSHLAADLSADIAEVDLNPVIVHGEGAGVSVVDALIVRAPGT